ncbi:NAD(P)/FAD-dependent oxidoreductase [Aedoeadaptatus urinae]|uniref:NAD(P)/FAD-dependent oxidoreductase n=1 Tax=Aedoeadaptatus urinae TaxID=1871017 RepID=UPI00097DBB88|nr:FAD-dependent oxidoreductase [Peptoniphilus urinae]
MKTYDYLIMGSGIAGVTAAKEIRKKDKEGSILLLGNEKERPYFRIELTACLSEENPAIPYLDKEDWAEKLNIDTNFDAEVSAVDFDAMTVTTEKGDSYQGEKILLANGSHANLPPFNNREVKGVFTLRSWADLMEIESYLNATEGEKRIGVIGGGLLGLEAARSLQKRGNLVAIVDMEEYLLSKQLDRELGMSLNEEMKDHGFMVYTDRSTKGFIGDDHLTGIEFDDGTVVDLDMVLVSIGVRPNTALFTDTGLEVNRGVVVDRSLKTNKEKVWAAGDVAEVEGRCMGIWPAARAMGKAAGANMAGGNMSYEDPKVYTKLDLGTIQIFSAGIIGEGNVYFYDDGPAHHRLYEKDGKVVGVILYGDTKAMNTYRKLVEEGAPIEEALSAFYEFNKVNA